MAKKKDIGEEFQFHVNVVGKSEKDFRGTFIVEGVDAADAISKTLNLLTVKDVKVKQVAIFRREGTTLWGSPFSVVAPNEAGELVPVEKKSKKKASQKEQEVISAGSAVAQSLSAIEAAIAEAEAEEVAV